MLQNFFRFTSPPLLSNITELQDIAELVQMGARIPLNGDLNLEDIVAKVRGGRPTRSKDFADVVAHQLGWQVKRGNTQTTMTWKRIALTSHADMVNESRNDMAARQSLGDLIIDKCNKHVRDSFKIHELQAIGYCRLIINGRSACYFERELCTDDTTPLFQHDDFEWIWSEQSVLHGIHRTTGERWFGWNGVRSDNQLHFVGERYWWPADGDAHCIRFDLPNEFPLDEFLERCKTTVVEPT